MTTLTLDRPTTYATRKSARQAAQRKGLDVTLLHFYETKAGWTWSLRSDVSNDINEIPVPFEDVSQDDDFGIPAFLMRNMSSDGALEVDEPGALDVEQLVGAAEVSIYDLTPESHPIAAANAASWPTPKRKAKASLVSLATAVVDPASKEAEEASKVARTTRLVQRTKEAARAVAAEVFGADAVEGTDFVIHKNKANGTHNVMTPAQHAELVAPKRTEKAKAAKTTNATTAREGSKRARIVELALRPEGVSIHELVALTGWNMPNARNAVKVYSTKAGVAGHWDDGVGNDRRYFAKRPAAS